MPEIGIKSYAAYVPRLRMERAAIAAAHAWALPSLRGLAKGERSFGSWDEDSVTMSVEAARACLRGTSAAQIAALTYASTTPVFADLQNATLVCAAAGLDGAGISTLDASGSLRAATSAGACADAMASNAASSAPAAAERRTSCDMDSTSWRRGRRGAGRTGPSYARRPRPFPPRHSSRPGSRAAPSTRPTASRS